MIRFEFSTEDLPEEDREFYHNTFLEFQQGHDLNISEIVEKFKIFLAAMTFAEKNIEQIKTPFNYEDDEDIRNFLKQLESNREDAYQQASINSEYVRNYMRGNIHAND